MLDDSVTLTLAAPWNATDSGQNIVLFIQATTSSVRLQRARVTGIGLPDQPVERISSPEMAYGKQYLNYQFILPPSALESGVWNWQVAIASSNDNGETWLPSAVRVSDAISPPDGLMCSVFALANDAADMDRDFNDTVLQVSAFNNSSD